MPDPLAPDPAARLAHLLDLAKEKQARLLPDPPTTIDGVECAVGFESAEPVAGDFYDFLHFPQGRLGVIQGDVAGQGIEVWGDMVMAMVALRLYALLGTGSGHPDLDADAYHGPAQIEPLGRANDFLHANLEPKSYVSATYLMLDAGPLEMRVVRCGHPPVLVYNPDRQPDPLLVLEPEGMVLGAVRGKSFTESLRPETVQLYAGDVVLLYTNGIVEIRNDQDEKWGRDRFFEVFQTVGHLSAPEIVQALMQEARAFGDPTTDHDATLTVVKVL